MLVKPTKCPHCGEKQIGASRYEYRFIDVDGPLYNSEKLRAIEIYCANCHYTLTVVPVMK